MENIPPVYGKIDDRLEAMTPPDKPTDTGATYRAAARRILDEVHAAEREAAGEFNDPRGDLAVTAPRRFRGWLAAHTPAATKEQSSDLSP